MTAASRQTTGHDWNCTELQRNVCVGTSSPIVERVDIYANFVLPHALAIDDREGEDWLYWSNSEDGTISAPDAGKERVSLMYSLESKGTISQIELPSPNTSITSPSLAQVRLGKTMTARQKASILPDDASIVSPGVVYVESRRWRR
ncbi:hypothetical protein GQ600_481 [Phytophthora cactorum]|nr:hypothetical protein GQ600_481 [Phytophthora cactorum]